MLSHSVVSNSLRPHWLQPARLLCPWNSPGKSTGWAAVPSSRGSSQPMQVASPETPALPAGSLSLSHPGSRKRAQQIHILNYNGVNSITNWWNEANASSTFFQTVVHESHLAGTWAGFLQHQSDHFTSISTNPLPSYGSLYTWLNWEGLLFALTVLVRLFIASVEALKQKNPSREDRWRFNIFLLASWSFKYLFTIFSPQNIWASVIFLSYYNAIWLLGRNSFLIIHQETISALQI